MSERLQRNQLVIDEFRSSAGVVGGDFAGVPLLLLTTTGARSGESRVMPVTYLEDGGRLVIFGANGGRANHPGWYHNLLADPAARVEVGAESFAVTASVAEGAEHDRLWARQLPHTPYFAGFQERAGRRIPVVVLTRDATS
ncbi:nitroreductase family deazaflavin-dependent oxidoreductase [Streptomyces sp. TLI_171]|uniref:nitroreductase family deazaflavin-dependent oxidoreductase n=1 Tax=Streptomyces sp. TLI_171 TaxID=1938859 RepID=UPI000C19DC3F|nr:nitroreductase family deazaflavin-dependent oxidoreductase [Streptomyces sp. TLI_171]RKE21776.1 deazaflavin-dependent oxidoreductase (nitroreductase family) [Streptomyces sp. TLI_171]